MSTKKHIVYRIYYGDTIVYVGRTNQNLRSRIRGHLFEKPMQRKIDINQVSYIDYAEFESEADMNLYEIYYILKLHPVLNVDDKTKDFPTVSLPVPDFMKAEFPLWDKWKQQLALKESERIAKSSEERRLIEELRILRSSHHLGEISDDDYFSKHDDIKEKIDTLRIDRKRGGW